MQEISNKRVLLYITVAFVFSLLIHLIWVYLFYGYAPFMWNGQFMINTNDGYYWAEGARDIVAGFHQPNDLSPVDAAPSILTAYLYKLLPFSFESVIFYMSAILSSLVVIPIILIAHSFRRLEVGFVAALLASIAWSYYNRTLVGYYDTDMLNIVFPMFLLWSLVLALRTQELRYLLYTALEIIAYRAWYPQSYALEFAFFSLILIYTGYRYYKKQSTQFHLMLMTFMLFAMMGLAEWLRLLIVIALYMSAKRELLQKYVLLFFGSAVVLFFVTGGFTPIWEKLKLYIFRENMSANEDIIKLHFFTVMQTIREAGEIPFTTFANRISGHSVTFILSLVGYVWMLWRYPLMLLSLPLAGLGFLAYVGGLRFTIYAVPVMAMGLAFLIFEAARFFHNEGLKRIFIAASVLLVLAPNIWHAWEYRIPTVFVHDEVKVLDELKHTSSREDYVLAWWDYGYPIRYYADVKTLVDGGKHSGDVNFPVSFALTRDQLRAAKMARLDVEYTERKYALLDQNETDLNDTEAKRSNLAQMMLDYGYRDANTFLEALALDEIKPPKKSRDVYFYLPNRMLTIFPTVARFSYIDLMDGKELSQPLFLLCSALEQKGKSITLLYQNRFKFLLDLQKGSVLLGDKELSLRSFYVTYYDRSMHLRVQQTPLHERGLSVIYMKNYNTFLIVDEAMLHSTYVELFVFEHYNKELFEPVILSPLAKVYKLKL